VASLRQSQQRPAALAIDDVSGHKAAAALAASGGMKGR